MTAFRAGLAATCLFMFLALPGPARAAQWKHVEISGSADKVCAFAAQTLRVEISEDPVDLLQNPKLFRLLEKGLIASIYEVLPSNPAFIAAISVHEPKAPNSQLLIVDRGKRPNVSIADIASFDGAASILWHDEEGSVLFGAYYTGDKRKRFNSSRDAASQLWRRESQRFLGHFFLRFDYENRSYFIDRSVGHDTAYIFSLNEDLVPHGHCFFKVP